MPFGLSELLGCGEQGFSECGTQPSASVSCGDLLGRPHPGSHPSAPGDFDGHWSLRTAGLVCHGF